MIYIHFSKIFFIYSSLDHILSNDLFLFNYYYTIQIISTSMTASADKVQHILQTCLEQSAPLVRRGVFSQSELQSIMRFRQKHEHAMLKREYRLTDYLASIEYEYDLERERRSRMTELGKLQEGSNPIFRKQSSADFAIVKRIIRLWDRTMHKYKFQLRLWKQYLSFTMAIGSKKHFYKALTNALRFQPFEVDLWKIGAAYEMEQGKNLWKGRKILIKGMKMVPAGARNLELAQFMVNYQVNFLRTLAYRRDILIKGQQGIKMIGGEEEQINQEQQSEPQPQVSSVNLEEFDRVIWLVVEQAISKNVSTQNKEYSFNKLKQRLMKLLIKSKNDEQRSDVKLILQKVIDKLGLYEGQNQCKIQEAHQNESQIKLKQQQQQNDRYQAEKVNSVNYWKQLILANSSDIDWQMAKKALRSFCLKPALASEILNFLLQVDQLQTVKFLVTKNNKTKIPSGTLLKLIEIYLGGSTDSLGGFIATQIDRWVTVGELRENKDLFQKIARFNGQENRLSSTTRLLRSVSIAYRGQPQFLQMCNRVSDTF